MVQNWFLSYRIAINSINTGIKINALLLWGVCAGAQYGIKNPYAPIKTLVAQAPFL